MKHLTGTERLLIVAIAFLLLIGGIVRYSRALRDASEQPIERGPAQSLTEDATRPRTNQL